MYLRMTIILALLSFLTPAEGIKFKRGDNFLAPGETVLVVGQPSDLTCDYIKWKNEKLHSITWSIQYSGVRTNFFVWHMDGKKESISLPIVSVDENSSEDKTVRVSMVDGMKDEELSVCCEVKVIKDEGYGSMKPLKKKKCSEVIQVTEGTPAPELILTSSQPDASVGDMLELQCYPEEPSPIPIVLVITLNGKRVSANTKAGGIMAIVQVDAGHFQTRARSIGGFNQQVGLSDKAIVVECLGKYGSKLAGQTSLTIQQKMSASLSRHSLGSVVDQGQLRNARNYLTDQHLHDKGVPCHSFLLVEEGDQGTVVRGKISSNIVQDMASTTPIAADRIYVTKDVVTILNVLGYHGYKVVGVGNLMDNRMVWTLERKYFESHKDEL